MGVRDYRVWYIETAHSSTVVSFWALSQLGRLRFLFLLLEENNSNNFRKYKSKQMKY